MSKWIRKGDKVAVISGNEKGRTGTVRSRKGDRIVIEGLNVRKKHVKQKSRVAQGIIEIEASIHISNVCLCDSEGKPVKVKVKTAANGQKELVHVAGGKEVTYRKIKQSNAK